VDWPRGGAASATLPPVNWEQVRQQGGVFTRDQARWWGLSDRQIDGRLAAGLFVPANGTRAGVLMAAGTPWSREAAVWSALFAVGTPCTLMGPTAAAWYGWCDPESEVWVAVPRNRTVRRPPRVRLMRLEVRDSEVVMRGLLPVTSPARTLVDCLRFLPRDAASAVLDRSQQRGTVDLSEAAAMLSPKGRGTRQARQLLASADGAVSAAERLLVSLLRGAGITGWHANYPVQLRTRSAVIDVAFPELKVAVEVDGFAYHSDVERFRDDRVRQNALVTAGWLVLRFTWYDLVQTPDAVLDEIRDALASRTHSR
jgi:very-short-patch-repair endonuclease